MKTFVFVAIIFISLVAGVPTSPEVSSPSHLPTNERIFNDLIEENPLLLLIAIILLLTGQGGEETSLGSAMEAMLIQAIPLSELNVISWIILRGI